MCKALVSRVFLSLGLLALTGANAAAETAYVTDMLQLDLYAAGDMNGPAIRKLRSGDRMEIIQRVGRTAEVRLDDGETGWVKSLYLVDEEPARTRVNSLEDDLAEYQSTVGKLEEQLAAAKGRANELQSAAADEDSAIASALAELEVLREENADMESSLEAYSASVPLSWVGALLVLTLIGGFAAGWYWFDSRSRARHGGYRIH